MKYLKHLFTALLMLCATTVAAHDFEVGGIYYNILSETDKTVEVTYRGTSYDSYNEYTGSVVILENVTYNGNTYSITSIGNYAFRGCSGLTSIVIGNSVTSIGNYAFSYCDGLKSITIPNSVTSIGYAAFAYCSGLTSVVIPNSVTSIGNEAFRGCPGLTSIEIPNSVTSIGSSTFDNCTGLTSIVIGNSVTSIGSSAFRGCSGLTSIEIPNSVTSIGSYAFYSCTGLTSITIPNCVTSIEDVAFAGCSGLTSIEIPNSVTSIGRSAFSGCTGLTSITIPNSVTSIGEVAFSGCSGLTSIIVDDNNTKYDSRENCNAIIETETNTLIAGCKNTIILNSVTSIGNSAFSGCSGLTSVEIPNSVISIGNYAFRGCTSLKELRIEDGEGTLSLGYNKYEYPVHGEGLFYDCPLETLYLGRNLSYNTDYSYGSSPFCNINTLASVTIGNSVTSIGNEAFYNCTGLKTVINFSNLTFSKGSSEYGYVANYADKVYNAPNGFIDGDFIWYENKDGMTLAGYLGNATELAMPTDYNGKSVTSIGSSAFYGCSGLTSIEIPNSVTSIGSSAFYGCSGLTSVEFNAENCTIMGSPYDPVFSNCTSLSTVTIGENVKNIPDYAFRGCSGLTSIEIPKSVTSIGDEAFYGCSGLTSVVIGNSVTSIENYAFSGCTGLTSIEIPNSVTSIGNSAFNGCTGLTSIEIPNSVTSIGNSAFSGCSGLTSIEIPKSVTSIGDQAFYGCTGLTSIEIPNSVTSIGNYAFWNCSGLTSVVIGNSVTTIGNRAFYGCTGLTSIEIPNSVTSIGDYAFTGCKGLKTVYNFSNLTFSKGSSNNGYVAYYTDKVYNAPNGSFEGDFIFGKPNDVNTLLYYLGNDTELTLPADYNGENYAIGAAVFQNYTGLAAELIIPNSVTSIGSSAFYGCTGLTSIEIPNSVTSIGKEAFYGCTGLKTVYNFSNLTFSKGTSSNGYVAWYADKVYNAPNGFIDGDFIWSENEDGMTLAGYLGNATGLALPADYKGKSVTSIGSDAFNGCTGLTSIEIPNSVTSIGKEAFYGCNNIEKLYIGSSVESIGDKAFAGCEKITEIKVALEKPIKGSADIFADAVYDNATLYIPNGTEQLYQKREPWNLFFYIAEMDFTGIDEVYDEVKVENGEVKTIYDLQGRKVEVPIEGLYIIDGKKVMIK